MDTGQNMRRVYTIPVESGSTSASKELIDLCAKGDDCFLLVPTDTNGHFEQGTVGWWFSGGLLLQGFVYFVSHDLLYDHKPLYTPCFYCRWLRNIHLRLL